MMHKCTMHMMTHVSILMQMGWHVQRGVGGCRPHSPPSPATPDVVKKNNSKNNYSQGWGQVPTAPKKKFTVALPS